MDLNNDFNCKKKQDELQIDMIGEQQNDNALIQVKEIVDKKSFPTGKRKRQIKYHKKKREKQKQLRLQAQQIQTAQSQFPNITSSSLASSQSPNPASLELLRQRSLSNSRSSVSSRESELSDIPSYSGDELQQSKSASGQEQTIQNLKAYPISSNKTNANNNHIKTNEHIPDITSHLSQNQQKEENVNQIKKKLDNQNDQQTQQLNDKQEQNIDDSKSQFSNNILNANQNSYSYEQGKLQANTQTNIIAYFKANNSLLENPSIPLLQQRQQYITQTPSTLPLSTSQYWNQFMVQNKQYLPQFNQTENANLINNWNKQLNSQKSINNDNYSPIISSLIQGSSPLPYQLQQLQFQQQQQILQMKQQQFKQQLPSLSQIERNIRKIDYENKIQQQQLQQELLLQQQIIISQQSIPNHSTPSLPSSNSSNQSASIQFNSPNTTNSPYQTANNNVKKPLTQDPFPNNPTQLQKQALQLMSQLQKQNFTAPLIIPPIVPPLITPIIPPVTINHPNVPTATINQPNTQFHVTLPPFPNQMDQKQRFVFQGKKKEEVKTTTEFCYHCGQLGHLFNRCPYHALTQAKTPEDLQLAKQEIKKARLAIGGKGWRGAVNRIENKITPDILQNNTQEESQKQDQLPSTGNITYEVEPNACFRCGKTGHTSKRCTFQDNRVCFVCGGIGHVQKHCPIQHSHKQGKKRYGNENL